MADVRPEMQREFALQAVRRLRTAGFVAYWAGGCVRDQLLGRLPKDYDVATSATPAEIRDLFGHRGTLAIGAAFGVITVIGPRGAGAIEVATFRQDAGYSDGRHPDSVTFSSAEEDAKRRDFTINGLFFDPLEGCVIDFVGGQADLDRRVIRAIGRAEERFAEDKLRMLRAVRFAATFAFRLDPDTQAAVVAMSPRIAVVSPERIAMEMRRMLTDGGRVEAMRLLAETRLNEVVLPELAAAPAASVRAGLETLGRLDRPEFPLALAGLLAECVNPTAIVELGYRWRLANKEIDRAAWLVRNHLALLDARELPWSRLQPLLIAEGIDDLLQLTAATSPKSADAVAFCRRELRRPANELNPPPLITGDDLVRKGLPPGPEFALLLRRARDAQLDGEISSFDEAVALVDRLRAGGDNTR